MPFLNMGAGISGDKIGPEPQPETLLEPEFHDVFHTWKKEPTPANMSNLMKAVNPIVNRALKTYTSGNETSPTLYSKARLLAANAISSYDPSRSKLKTHLMYQLQGLRRAAAREERMISAPEQLLLDQKYIWDNANELTDQLGRPPSDLELADKTGLSLKRIAYARRIRDAAPESVFTSRNSEDGSFDPAVTTLAGNPNTAWHEFVYHSLDGLDQTIMEHRLGLHGKPVLQTKDLARLLNISSGAVSQRSKRIQDMIDKREEMGVI